MRFVFCLQLIAVSYVTARAQDAELIQMMSPFFQAEAQEYLVKTNDGYECKPTAKPVQAWSAGEYFGAVFVWEGPNRPEMIGCILAQRKPDERYDLMHELQSLSTSSLSDINVRDTRIFAAEKPGIEFLDVKVKSGVSPNPKLRLTQMRSLARECDMLLTGDNEVVLRVLTTPIYRYAETDDDNVIDGAIFAFVGSNGTDPEGLCVIEAIEKEGSRPGWRIGFARFTWRSMQASFRDQQVWSVQQDHGFWKAARVQSTYISGKVAELSEEEMRRFAADAKGGNANSPASDK